MSHNEIESAIPHRSPMLLLDEIVERDDRRIVCRKTFRDDEFFLQGHYPGHPIVPGVILCEATMQAGAVLLAGQLGDVGPGAVPVATRMNDVRFKRMVHPGETLEIEVTLNERLSNAFYLSGKGTVGGKLAVRFDFACTAASPKD